MKIKRFVAGTMREALAQVREELGPDAVIISNRRVDGGIELITAVDYDETLVEEALKRSKPAAPAIVESRPAFVEAPRATVAPPPARAAEPKPASRPASSAASFAAKLFGARESEFARPASEPMVAIARPPVRETAAPEARERGEVRTLVVDEAPARAAESAARVADAAPRAAEPPARPQVAWSQDPGVAAMRREVENLRDLLQQQLASLAWSDRLRREPQRARVLHELSQLGLAPDVARSLAERVPAGTEAGEPWRIPLALLLKHVPTVDDELLAKGGVFAVVGPTGVGKTTSIAKLATKFALAHGPRQVALVSLDHDRIGARDQLLTFARILGVPMHVATNARELGAVLAGLADRKLVLIDTAGMGPHDERLPTQFATLACPPVAPERRIRTLLALAANAEHLALDAIVNSYSRARPEAVLLTKLDEAGSLGPALSVVVRHALPVAHLCDGQRIPEDLHAAAPKRVWLVKQALKLAERARALAGVDDAYMAEHFGKVANHG